MSGESGSNSFCSFPTTQWTAIGHAGGGEGDAARRALGQLLTRYLPAMRAHLVLERRISRDAADDVLQGFVAGHVLEKNLVAQADRARGKFRTFLLTALNHYLWHRARHDGALSRSPGPGRHVPLDHHAAALPDGQPGSDAFDVAWAREVVREALSRMRAECERSKRPGLWALFEGRVVAPALEGTEPLAYEQMAGRFGFHSLSQATNALVTAKRMYGRCLRAVVAEYAGGDGEVEEELRHLKQILAGARAGSGSRRAT